MKIEQLPTDAAAAKKSAAAQKAADTAPQATPAASAPVAQAAAEVAGVPVTVSNQTRKLSSTGSTDGPVDVSKVEEMRDALDKGTFKVDADTIADKLLQDAQSLLSDARKSR